MVVIYNGSLYYKGNNQWTPDIRNALAYSDRLHAERVANIFGLGPNHVIARF